MTGRGGAGMLPSGVKRGAPATNWRVGALQGRMTKLLAVGALGVLVEAKVSLQLEGGGEGRQACSGGKVLCLRAGDGDDDTGDAFVGMTNTGATTTALKRIFENNSTTR